MKISLHWLKQYIDLNVVPEVIADHLTMIGFEVENVNNLAQKFDHFCVGEVVETIKHPQADRLTICKVNVGKETLQILCGAPNVQKGQKVAVGLIGAIVPHNQHDPTGAPLVLSQVKIRGEYSYGMICSEYELGLGDDKNGIMILDGMAIVGLPLAKYLGMDDIIFEVGITPNRPDVMSHIGIARELGALYKKKLKIPHAKVREEKRLASRFLQISIRNPAGCPRYTARLVFDVTIDSSPEWLQNKLRAVGIRPVNNIVDITNYVLMEIGHPLHAFDYDKLNGQRIVVQSASEGEVFTTLDHKSRVLDNQTLMICDAERSVAIAGIMGGVETEIDQSTKNIVIESAYFQPSCIRKSAKKYGLSTDASQRFERGADPNITRYAVDRAARLVQELSGGKVLKGTVDHYPKKISSRKIPLKLKTTNELLGTTLDMKTISQLLHKIEIQATGKSPDKVTFIAPTFRPDLEREADLIEEVARLYGYNNIETNVRSTIRISQDSLTISLGDQLREWLIGSGYHEAITNSMTERSIAGLTTDKYVNILNPISKDMEAMRTSLIPGMLQIVKENIFHGVKSFRFFETGHVFYYDPEKYRNSLVPGYREEEHLVLTLTGNNLPSAWDRKSNLADIFDLKGEVHVLLKKIFLDKFKFIPYSTTKALTEHGLLIEIYDEVAGDIGMVRKDMLNRFEIEQDVLVADINLDVLSKHTQKEKKYRDLPKYPSVTRDLALVFDEQVPVEHVRQEILVSGSPLLTSIDVFDIYRGNQIPSGKKSVAFALEFQSESHTLTQGEVDQNFGKIISNVSSKFQATIRS